MAAVPVTNVGWSTGAIVGAVQTIIVTLLGGGGLFGLFKGVGYLWSIANQRAAQEDTRDAEARAFAKDERAADFERLRTEIAEAKADAKAAGIKAETASKDVLRAQMQTAMLSAALSLVSAELERQDPGNPVIKQARDMVARAACEDVGFGADLRRLGTIKGADE